MQVYFQFKLQLHFDWLLNEIIHYGDWHADHLKLRIYTNDKTVVERVLQFLSLYKFMTVDIVNILN